MEKKNTPHENSKEKRDNPKRKKPSDLFKYVENCLFFFLMITKMNKSKTTHQKSPMSQKFSVVTWNVIWFPKLFFLVVEKFEAEGRVFSKKFEITVKVFETECFFYTILEVSQIWYIITIRIQIEKNNWNLPICHTAQYAKAGSE